MKQTLKRWMCRLFGHRMYEEVYAERLHRFSQSRHTPLYNVVVEHRCDRCGECDRTILRFCIRRSQLLKEGWFFEQ